MINAIDVLRVLEAFKALKATDDIPIDTKRRIAGELLTLVPMEIMVPSAKVTSETVRDLLKAFINDGKPSNSHEAKARKAPEEPSAPRAPQEAGVRSKESPAREDLVSSEVHDQVAGTGVGLRLNEPPEGALERPRVAGEKARGDEKRKAGKAPRRS